MGSRQGSVGSFRSRGDWIVQCLTRAEELHRMLGSSLGRLPQSGSSVLITVFTYRMSLLLIIVKFMNCTSGKVP